MKRQWIINPITFSLVLFLSGVLMIGCGNAKKEAGSEGATISTQQAATVGINVCTNCHAAQVNQWVGSVHANVNNTPAYGDFTAAICATCHDQLGDGQLLTAEVSTTGTLPRPIVGCESCHGGGGQHFGVGPISMTRVAADSTASGQFNTCTVCHQTASGYHGEANTSSYPTSTSTVFDGGKIIYDTHFYPMSITGPASSPTVSQLKTYPTYIDLGNTTALDGSGKTVSIAYNSGLVMKASERSCTASCHYPHAPVTTVNNQWKAGAHGDPLKPSVDHTFSKACIRCHLSTGYANLWTNYTSIAAGIIGLTADLTIPTNYQGQMRTCNTCHKGTAFPTSANKLLRKTGIIDLVAEGGTFVKFDASSKPTYTVKAVATTPDMGNSATCLTCHQGREAGDSVRANIDALATATTTTQSTNAKLKFINEHYLAAGATLFGGDGHKAFEYTDGLVSSGNTTNNIPAQTYVGKHFHYTVGCVGCHMQTTGITDLGGHSFLMDNGTAINNGICATCHTGGIANFDTYRLPTNTLDYDGDGTLEGIHDELDGLKTALIDLFASKAIYYNPVVYPYFHNVATGQSSSTGYTNWTQSQLKAAFNLNTFYKEPGAFAHNGAYAAEILIDAYTDLNGGTLVGSALANAQRP
ncbi:MAG TPA: hypothetical protein VIX18_00960 [Nitrospirota bacterium]